MMNPFYTDNCITLYHGDCIEVMKRLGDDFDACITDPPYFVLPNGKFGDDFKWDSFEDYGHFLDFTRLWHDELMGHMKEHSCEFIFWSQKYMKDGFDLFEPSRLCFWHHANLINVGGMNDFAFDYEPIFVKWHGVPMLRKEGRKSCFFSHVKPQSNFNGDQKLVHPTQKPVGLISEIVGQLDGVKAVIDPFAGSGTTGLACLKHGLKCIMIEKDEEYCRRIVQRIKAYNPQMELF